MAQQTVNVRVIMRLAVRLLYLHKTLTNIIVLDKDRAKEANVTNNASIQKLPKLLCMAHIKNI